MTEEDRKNTEKQLTALSEAYSELSQQCSDRTNSADEVGFYRCFVPLHLLQLCAVTQTVQPDVQLHDLLFVPKDSFLSHLLFHFLKPNRATKHWFS